jgi:hypothetical protein
MTSKIQAGLMRSIVGIVASSVSTYVHRAAEKVHLLRCFAIRRGIDFQPLLRSGADSRSSEILTYDPVRSGLLLPAALHLELFEQPAGVPEFFSTRLERTDE